MSWQAYIDDQLTGAGLHQAAIIGHDGMYNLFLFCFFHLPRC